jgi:drug/metabolite transporter (DMT)-like permease
LGLALVGTALLVLEPVLNGHQLQLSLKGNLLILAHNLVIAAYYLLAKRFYKGQSKLMVTGIGYWASLLVLGLTLKLQGVTTTLTLLTVPSVAVAAVYMGVFGSIIALTFYVKGQDLIEASEATLFSYLTGVFALPTAYFLLGETPTLIQLVAIVIIASGVILGQYHRK